MEKKLYFYHDKSPINTLNHEVSNYQKAIVKEIKTITTASLNILLKKLNFDKHIDYINIDVFNGFDLEKYKPSVISVEFLDLKMKKLEFRNNELSRVINSDMYKILNNNNYSLINWLYGDLILFIKILEIKFLFYLKHYF
tara:strand:- start:88 stop:507 length:420 start_codon:yes stop_codon:yes gene_type:complete